MAAHGLDGRTGAHYLLRIYDDVVVPDSVSTPDQLAKTTAAWELSDNLGARWPDGKSGAWGIGTRYSYSDTSPTSTAVEHATSRQLDRIRLMPNCV